MKTLLLQTVPLGVLLLASVQSRAQWIIAPNSPAYTDYQVMSNLQIAYRGAIWANCLQAYGQGSFSSKLFTSVDAGQSWQVTSVGTGNYGSSVTLPPSGIEAKDVWALDASTAWMVTYNYATSQFALLKTATGPAGFAPITAPPTSNLKYVRFFNPADGVALANPGAPANAWGVYRTADGGTTWTSQSVPLTPTANENLVWCEVWGNQVWGATTRGNLIFTLNGGQTWAAASTGITTLRGVAFRNALEGLAYGYAGSTPAVRRTTDGGLTWTAVATSGPVRTRRMVALAGGVSAYLSVGTTPESGSSLSTDNGVSWRNIETSYDHDALAVDNANRVWASNAGSNASPLRSLMSLDATALGSRTARPDAVAAFPNPTTGVVTVAPVGFDRQAICVDALGKVVMQQAVPTGTSRIDLTACPVGLYQVRLEGGAAAPAYFQIIRQ